MAINRIHNDNTSGDITATLRSRPGHISVADGREIENRFNSQTEIDRNLQDLPATQEQDSNIKFLGSSYSGVDVKVVAHLYNAKNWNEEKLEKETLKRATSQNIVDGCSSLINGGFASLYAVESENLSYSLQREVFLNAAGLGGGALSDEGQQARQVLLANVFKTNDFSFIGLARMARRAESLKKVNESLVTEYNQSIEHIQSLGSVNTSSTVTLGTLQTISVQSFREKNAVRAFGHAYAKGYTRGTRTIGGSCIFTIFNEHALAELIRNVGHYGINGERDSELSTLLPDQLPPIDLTIVFANEYGALSDFRLYGVEFCTDGQVFSIEDLLSEETMNFVCRDADVMTSRGNIQISRLQRGMFNGKDDKDKSGSSLLFDNQDYYEHLNALGVRRRLTNR